MNINALNAEFHRTSGGKAQEVTTKIKDAWQAVSELTAGTISISVNLWKTEVLLTSMRDLEQVPGEVQYEVRDCEEFPWEAVKVYDGVTFCCLLRTDEYEAWQKAS